MKVPPFKLDAWLVAHEFATPPIRYNIASSTGPLVDLGRADGAGRRQVAPRALDDLTLSYAPPQGSKLLRERIAALHGVDPDHVLVMTGASEALMALTCLFAEPGASIVLPQAGVSGGAGAGARLGHGVREYALRPRARFRADRGRRAGGRGCQHARGVRQHASQPHGFGDAGHRAAQARRSAGRARHSADRRRGLSPAVFRRARRRARARCPTPSCSATSPRRCRSRACASAGSSIAMRAPRGAARHAQLFHDFGLAADRGGRRACARARAGDPRAAARRCRAPTSRCSRGSWTNIATCWAGRRPAGGTTCFPWLRDGRDARPLCEALAKAGVLAAPGDCFDMPAHFRVGFGAMRSGYADALGDLQPRARDAC